MQHHDQNQECFRVVYGKDCSETEKLPFSLTWFQNLFLCGLYAITVTWQVLAPEAHCECITCTSLKQDLKLPPQNLLFVPIPKAQQGSQSVVSKPATAAIATLKVLHGPVNWPLKYKPSGFFSHSNTVNALLKCAELLTHLSDLQEHPLCT